MADFTEAFFPIQGVNEPLAPDNYVMADTIPNYTLIPSPGYGEISTPTYVTAPDTSGGFFGSLGDFFSNTVPSATINATSSIANWFSQPSNSTAAVSAGGGLLNSVASFFKGNNNQSNKANQSQQPAGLGVGGALRALMGLGPPPSGQQSITQAAGSGLGNIIGGATKPLIPILVLIVGGLIVFFLILGRVQRAAG